MAAEGLQEEKGAFSYRAGNKRLYLVWWVAGVLLQILLCLPFIVKKIRWQALGITFLVFFVVMYTAESIALYWGWWVWNENQLWGLKVGLVPLEEFLLYLLVVPSLVAIQCVIQNVMDLLQKGN